MARVHPKVITKIHELVGAGITEVSEVKLSYAQVPLIKIKLTILLAMIYQITISTIKTRPIKSCSENKGMEKNQPWFQLYFRPYKKKSTTEQLNSINTEEHITEYEQTLLWVHQEPWQQDLLVKYGNTIGRYLMTTHYELPLFFVCVRTNVGYSAVAEYHKWMEDIAEASKLLKQWRSKFFMSDYSEAKISAVEQTFPATKLATFNHGRGG